METKKSIFKKWWFWVIIVVVFAVVFGSSGKEGENETTAPKATESVKVENNENTDTAKVTEEIIEEQKETEKEMTMGEKNALEKADDYLSFMAFSKKGLIKQLEFEGFTNEEAKFAANNCGANWNEQAVLKAETYLETMSFSKESLIEQLEFEGFTHEQAVYGAEQNGY